MLIKLYTWLHGLLASRPVRLAIVRRYADANGSYVGELYMEQEQNGVSSYRMIGCSLDSFPVGLGRLFAPTAVELDVRNDFLAPMPPNVVRVGALTPSDNDRVRRMVAGMPRKGMTITIQNRFIEHVMERKT